MEPRRGFTVLSFYKYEGMHRYDTDFIDDAKRVYDMERREANRVLLIDNTLISGIRPASSIIKSHEAR